MSAARRCRTACPGRHRRRRCSRSRPEAFGLTLELLAGAAGIDRLITSPHVQKTGLALAGFHEYLKPGRVLIFGESEIRYLESLDAGGAYSTRCGWR